MQVWYCVIAGGGVVPAMGMPKAAAGARLFSPSCTQGTISSERGGTAGSSALIGESVMCVFPDGGRDTSEARVDDVMGAQPIARRAGGIAGAGDAEAVIADLVGRARGAIRVLRRVADLGVGGDDRVVERDRRRHAHPHRQRDVESLARRARDD